MAPNILALHTWYGFLGNSKLWRNSVDLSAIWSTKQAPASQEEVDWTDSQTSVWCLVFVCFVSPSQKNQAINQWQHLCLEGPNTIKPTTVRQKIQPQGMSIQLSSKAFTMSIPQVLQATNDEVATECHAGF